MARVADKAKMRQAGAPQVLERELPDLCVIDHDPRKRRIGQHGAHVHHGTALGGKQPRHRLADDVRDQPRRLHRFERVTLQPFAVVDEEHPARPGLGVALDAPQDPAGVGHVGVEDESDAQRRLHATQHTRLRKMTKTLRIPTLPASGGLI